MYPLKVLAVILVLEVTNDNIGVFSQWSGTFIEFSEFRESEESLKHEMGSVKHLEKTPITWSNICSNMKDVAILMPVLF